ncbi:MAG: hypothetical protein RIQ81_2400 [Pseudomonadota bacterium]|jgi:hypothetical protein
MQILPGKKKVRMLDEAFDRASSRLEEGTQVDISVGMLALLITGVIALACGVKAFDVANPRLSYPGQPLAMDLDANETAPGIWFSMAPDDDKVILTTDDRRIFEWSLDPEEALDSAGYREFEKFLKERRRQIVENLVLSMSREDLDTRSMAVVSLDDRLTYAHFKPVMLALVGAGIRSYGFETLVAED